MDDELLDNGADHLTSLELIAATDGEGSEASQLHLRHCRRCQQRIAALRAWQQALRRYLYRALCPTTDQLVDYCQGLLDPGQHALIAHHVASCLYCRTEIDLLMQRDPLIDRLLLHSLLNDRVFRILR